LPNAPATVAVCLEDPESKASVWSTNAQGNLRFRRDAGDENPTGTVRYNTASYDWSANRLSSATDEAGSTTTYSYNGLGQIIGSVATGADGSSFTSSFPIVAPAPVGVGDIDKAITALGTAEQRIWDFTYDLLGKGTMTSVIDPLGKETKMTYYDRGTLKSVEDANGKVTTYGETALPDGGYHASGQPGKITDPLGKVTSFSYDFLGFQETRVDRKSQTWSTDYDLRGNLLSSVTPVGDTTSYCYDANDNPTLVMPPRTASRSCSLDGTDGNSIKTTYDDRDLVSSTLTKSDNKIRKSTYGYYDDGELKEILEPRSFDPDSGALLATLQKATYLRFPNNRISAFTDEEGDTTDVLYTPHGLVEKMTEPAGDAGRHTTTFTYNRLGQIKSAQESGHTKAMRYDYNLHGDTTKQTTPRDTFTLFTRTRWAGR
jgi:YD repeat-containing protein